jgi:hypothetical protein
VCQSEEKQGKTKGLRETRKVLFVLLLGVHNKKEKREEKLIIKTNHAAKRRGWKGRRR